METSGLEGAGQGLKVSEVDKSKGLSPEALKP